jgi:hypothetical protein
MEIDALWRTVPKATRLGAQQKTDLRGKIKEWLAKVQDIAHEFGARDYTICAEMEDLPKVSASFTWSAPRGRGGETS